MARRLGIGLLLALVALLPTWKFLGGAVPAPVDWAHHSAPWNEPEPQSAYDILAMDGALQFLPWRDYMLQSYRAGHVPLWNHASLGGTTFLANSQSAPLYPLHWLWPFDAESLLGFSAWLHLVIVGLGVFALCRRLGSTSWGGLIAAISVQLSAFFIAWIPLPSVLMTAAWIPWCLWGVLWVGQAASPRSVGVLAGCVGMMLLAGHLQIAAYGLLAVCGFVVWLLVFPTSPTSRTRVLWAVSGLVLGGMIASPQLLPAIENGRQGHRAAPASAEGWEAYKASAATPLELVTLVSPDFFGTPQPRNEQTGMTSYRLAYTKPGRHYAEIAFYVGPVVLPFAAFALVGIRRRPQVGFFAVLALLGLAIAMGTPIAQALYFGVPGWSATGSPARAAVLVTLGLCVLAGLGLREDWYKMQLNLRAVSIAGPVIGGLLFLAASSVASADVTSVFGSAVPLGVMYSGLVALYIVIMPQFGLRLPAWVWLFAVSNGSYPGLLWSDAGSFKREFPGMTALQNAGRVAVVGDDWSFLTAPTKTIAPPNTLLPYGIKEIGGYDSIVSAKYKAKLDDANGRDSAPSANGNMMLVHPDADLAKLRAMGADALMASTQFTYDLPVLFDGGNWRLYRLSGEDPQPFLFHEIYNHKKLRWVGEYRSQTRGWLNSPDANGWEMSSATFDFNEKTVLAIYRPHSYRLGLLLAMVGGAAAIALSFGGGASRAQDEERND